MREKREDERDQSDPVLDLKSGEVGTRISEGNCGTSSIEATYSVLHRDEVGPHETRGDKDRAGTGVHDPEAFRDEDDLLLEGRLGSLLVRTVPEEGMSTACKDRTSSDHARKEVKARG